ncbi:MAG TPA: enoyl-CoA hydratase/isomerase family protein [Blastocatellia bacterium]|nr:enoyl-CoA hydratase/isomerase family protein [Blastocatellia bacterium]
MSEMIELEMNDGIATLRLSRPPANALDLPFITELAHAFAELENRGDVRALIVTGAGRFFSAGLDLKAVPTYGREEQRALATNLNRMVGRLYGLSLPVVAAVNGHCIAGGVIVALSCDYRVGAAGDYKIGLTEARVGVVFPVAPMAVVQSELSHPAARRAVLLARNVGPQEALAEGMLDELQPEERLLARATEIAEEMASLPRTAYGRIKRQMRAAALARIDDAVNNDREPVLDSWLGEETASASAQVLARDRSKE